ncbi:MAG: hypothetical protein ACRYFX_26085 [Janthinobacterium lividum]
MPDAAGLLPAKPRLPPGAPALAVAALAQGGGLGFEGGGAGLQQVVAGGGLGGQRAGPPAPQPGSAGFPPSLCTVFSAFSKIPYS